MESSSDINQEIFERIAEILGEQEFSCEVLAFLSEHCHHFEDKEENELVHTNIHHDYR